MAFAPFGGKSPARNLKPLSAEASREGGWNLK
jgi:hypothetical protein